MQFLMRGNRFPAPLCEHSHLSKTVVLSAQMLMTLLADGRLITPRARRPTIFDLAHPVTFFANSGT